MSCYTIGVDFGNNSGRAVLVDVSTGEVVKSATYDYYYGIMSKNFIDGMPLPNKFALAHPQDFLDVLSNVVREVISEISLSDIIGIGIDCSSCSMLPVTSDGTPLCFLNEFKNNPHAYVKLTMHTSAIKEAKKLTSTALNRNEKFISIINNSISPEMMLSKILETYNEAPEVYNAAAHFVEVADWLVWRLTGNNIHNSYSAAYKSFWTKEDGYPSKDYFKAIDEGFENVIADKLSATIKPAGTLAGTITRQGSRLCGLNSGTAVSVASPDLLSCVPAVKMYSSNKMIAVMGKSTIFMVLADKSPTIKGLSGPSTDSVFENTISYKGKQECVGETYSWFLNNYIPPEYLENAKKEGRNTHSYMAQQMMKLKPGENGILALNWLRGNKSVLENPNLSALFVGLTPDSKTEHLYRAIIEGMAFDTRRIIDVFEAASIEIDTFFGVGTIAERNAFIMQLYADILKTPIKVAGSPLAPAIGSAIFASVAAGVANGGYKTIADASKVMGTLKPTTYYPILENSNIYDKMYEQYVKLYNMFSSREDNIMTNLKNIQQEVMQ